MEQWWERNKDVTLDDDMKAEVEDITGCIPLLLNECVVDGKINLEIEAFDEIYQQAAGFVQDVKIYHKSEWNWYVKFI